MAEHPAARAPRMTQVLRPGALSRAQRGTSEATREKARHGGGGQRGAGRPMDQPPARGEATRGMVGGGTAPRGAARHPRETRAAGGVARAAGNKVRDRWCACARNRPRVGGRRPRSPRPSAGARGEVGTARPSLALALRAVPADPRRGHRRQRQPAPAAGPARRPASAKAGPLAHLHGPLGLVDCHLEVEELHAHGLLPLALGLQLALLAAHGAQEGVAAHALREEALPCVTERRPQALESADHVVVALGSDDVVREGLPLLLVFELLALELRGLGVEVLELGGLLPRREVLGDREGREGPHDHEGHEAREELAPGTLRRLAAAYARLRRLHRGAGLQDHERRQDR
eukprot:CAMPEP_0206003744 /NCGR_PEP_ID=MMETSP1464-20131121/3561_1 /ASSEMBLY_ACC=CAM_ASM_001124 /TAXON_ID=119497 /ORGANISM="Exanthemachrysis gayraliae, Strain RCC1523" /LENGTH=345 /DNA_ID=CAMNT_0053377133 /DNA_START=158 /DNA_END=1193 /DNA_ORIENTATION=-